ncbi:hypothetical protein SAMN05216534_1629 [Candidatus Aquiluna sp. UB-MaderosW2red]|nr:hypothetical protein SAMN05216534_1629 [Candidatus Aquiluna sp. UB-MaderosW2red]
MGIEGQEKLMAQRQPKLESFTPQERAAIKERAKEQQKASTKESQEAEVLLKISQMSSNDKALAQKIHELVKTFAPELDAKTWYGMPAYARAGKTILFFQDAGKFKVRYATLGFSEHANLDGGNMWPNAYALIDLDKQTEEQIIGLIKKAIS